MIHCLALTNVFTKRYWHKGYELTGDLAVAGITATIGGPIRKIIFVSINRYRFVVIDKNLAQSIKNAVVEKIVG